MSRYSYVRNLARMIAFFRTHDEFTRRELQQTLGMSRTTLESTMHALRTEPTRQIHICAWREDRWGKPNVAVYAFGDKPDVKRRAPRSAVERQRLYRQRKKIAAQAIAQTAMDCMLRVDPVLLER